MDRLLRLGLLATGVLVWAAAVLVVVADNEEGWEVILVLLPLGGVLIGVATAGACGGFLAGLVGAMLVTAVISSMWVAEGTLAGLLAMAGLVVGSLTTRARRAAPAPGDDA